MVRETDRTRNDLKCVDAGAVKQKSNQTKTLVMVDCCLCCVDMKFDISAGK